MDDCFIFVTFYEGVMRNPAMYTLTGTFGEAVSFLEGYYSGLARVSPYAGPVREWAAFHRWLSVPLRITPRQYFMTLLEEHGDGQAALSALLNRLLEFKQHRIANPADTIYMQYLYSDDEDDEEKEIQ